jgi:hypothetical protein
MYVSMYVYVYVYICMYVCMYVCMYIRIYINTVRGIGESPNCCRIVWDAFSSPPDLIICFFALVYFFVCTCRLLARSLLAELVPPPFGLDRRGRKQEKVSALLYAV